MFFRHLNGVAAAFSAWLALALMATGAGAESYPSRPIKIIVPNPPGGATDTTSRIVGARLSELLGQPVVIENRPGSAGNFANEVTAKSPADGYTIMLGQDSQIVINPYLYKTSAIDPLKEFVPVASLVTTVMILTVNPSLPVKDFHDFIAYARRANPPLPYASIGNGSQHHLAMEMLKARAGIDLVHVPYPGSPQVNTAILSGQVAAGFVVPATAMPLVESGRLKALAVTTSVRSVVLPEYPTLAEAGYPQVVSTAWQGVVAPAKTPKPIVERLGRELVAIVRSDEVRDRMIRLYFQPIGSSGSGLASLMHQEVTRWGKVIRKTGATAD